MCSESQPHFHPVLTPRFTWLGSADITACLPTRWLGPSYVAVLPVHAHWVEDGSLTGHCCPAAGPRPQWCSRGCRYIQIRILTGISKVAFRELKTTGDAFLTLFVMCSWPTKTCGLMFSPLNNAISRSYLLCFHMTGIRFCLGTAPPLQQTSPAVASACFVSLQASFDVPADSEECAAYRVRAGQRSCSSRRGEAIGEW